MRLNEILTESQDLEEGPLDAIGRGAAKVIGGVAKGAGMIGGIAGGVKKAYQKGKATSTAHIAGDVPAEPEDPELKKTYDDEYAKVTAPKQAKAAAQPAAPGQAPKSDSPFAGNVTNPAAPQGGNVAAEPAPAVWKNNRNPSAPATTKPGVAPSAADVNAQGPAGTAPAKPQTGAAAQAAAKTATAMGGQDTEKAGQTMYAQVKANVNKLDKKGKQRIMQLLQKSLTQAPAAAPAAPKKNLGFGFNTDTGEPFSSAEERTAAGEAGTMAAKEFPVRNKPVKVRGKAPAAGAASVQTAGKINSGNIIAEGFTFYRKK